MNLSPPVMVTVAKQFSAAAERVYDAWLDPTDLGRWMFGPNVRDEHIVRLDLEPRVGGRFSFVLNRQGTELDYVGEYLELDQPRLLVFTWGTRGSLPDASRVIVEIVPDVDGCELTLHHVLAPHVADFADQAAALWRRMLDLLDGILS